MSNEIKVPDIGDFKDVPVIEVHVKPGQAIKADDTLITLESDKATLDVPAPMDGVVGEVKLKTGDKVSQGSLILTLAGGAPAAAEVAGACELITHAVSLGGVDTLIQHPASLTHRPVEGDAKPCGGLLRVSVGLEDPEDLRADLAQALARI